MVKKLEFRYVHREAHWMYDLFALFRAKHCLKFIISTLLSSIQQKPSHFYRSLPKILTFTSSHRSHQCAVIMVLHGTLIGSRTLIWEGTHYVVDMAWLDHIVSYDMELTHADPSSISRATSKSTGNRDCCGCKQDTYDRDSCLAHFSIHHSEGQLGNCSGCWVRDREYGWGIRCSRG